MSDKKRKFVLAGLAFLAICALAVYGARHLEQPGGLVWYSIVPPLFAVTLAIATNRLMFSLGLAVVVGIVLSSVKSQPASIVMWVPSVFNHTFSVVKSVTDSFNLLVILFIVLILSTISVVIVSGGIQGIINWLTRFAKGPRSTQLVTVLMGFAVFIDDYANTMIVGSAMRPATDHQRISRAKLAYLVDSTTAPIAGLAVVSTWIGYEVGLFTEVANSLEIQRDGYSMFFDALGFRFYCMMTIIFVIANAISGVDYGPMRKAQIRARRTGADDSGDAKIKTSRVFTALKHSPSAIIHPLAAIVPIGTLFGAMLIGFWIDGGGHGSILSLSAWRNVLSEANNVKILTIASGSSFLLAIGCARLLSRIRLSEIRVAVLSGLKGSLLPTTILVLAWSLKAVCDQLNTGGFLAAAVEGVLSPIWFPALLFIVASVTSFATGTSWGTMAILIPTAIPVAFSLDGSVYGLTTMISLGAVLDGSIFGDHCSPISDTTIMSSIASECEPIHHVHTQLPYSLTVAGLALICGYIPAALGVSPYLAISVAAALIVLLLYIIGKLDSSQQVVA